MNLSRRFDLLISTSLILITFALYWQLSTHDFVIIDDNAYVTHNEHVKKGLSIKNIKWAFTTFHAEFYHPLTWLSLMLDSHLFGVTPGGYLFTNLLLHTFNSIILFIVFRSMTGTVWRSAFVAALFAIHPLNVESVAWIAMRKGLLSTFFAFLTIWCYICYNKNPSFLRYFLLVFLFLTGLLAKPMLVTLPFVLILIDFWPLHRLRSPSCDKYKGISITVSFVEKMPLFLISFLISTITFYAQKTGAGLVPLKTIPLSGRIANAIVSYVEYLKKMFWPSELTFFYRQNPDLNLSYVSFSILILVVITVFTTKMIHYHPHLFFGWLWYFGTLFPVIGLIKIGEFAMADRYAYMPLVGLFVAVSWGFETFMQNWRFKIAGRITGAVVILALLSFVTLKQIGYWKNSVTLFSHSIDITENNYLAHWGLAHAYTKNGKIEQSIKHIKEAIRIKPERIIYRNFLGRLLINSGNFEESISVLNKAIKVKSDFPNTYYNLGLANTALGHYDQAINNFSDAIRVKSKVFKNLKKSDPTKPGSEFEVALIFEREKQIDRAIDRYHEILELNPKLLKARQRLALLCSQRGEKIKALSLFGISPSLDWLKSAAAKGFENWASANFDKL